MFDIRVVHEPTFSRVQVHEEGGSTYPNGEPKRELEVQVIHPTERRKAEVSWPSTSDNRPELAKVVAEAIVVAARLAQMLDNGESLIPEQVPRRGGDGVH